MSDDGVIRDARGRVIKGSPGLHRKQPQPEPQAQSSDQSQQDAPSTFTRADILAAMADHGSDGKGKEGAPGFLKFLIKEQPTLFMSTFGKQAIEAVLAEADAVTTPGIGAVNILSCPADHYIAGDEMRALWAEKHGMQLTADAPPPQAGPPVLAVDNTSPPVVPRADNEGSDNDAPEPSPRRSDRATDMNDLLRATPRSRFTKPRDDEPWD